MGVDRSLVVGYGFVITEDELDEYIGSTGTDYDDVYEFLAVEVDGKHPGVETSMVGNEWAGETAFLVADASTLISSDVRDDMAGDANFGLYELNRVVTPPAHSQLVELQRQMIPGSDAEYPVRYFGWHAGIHVY